VPQAFDLIVLGAGPAGLAAAIYAARARLRTLVVDESIPGGQVKTTHLVSNYPGFPEDVKGADLARAFAAQAERFGAVVRRGGEVTALELREPTKRLELDEEEEVTAPVVILATGARSRELGIEGERKFRGRGLSYCSTCDGAYFEGKSIHVIGGGNSAVEESLFLTRFVKKITLIHQLAELTAEPGIAAELLAHPQIEVRFRAEPRAFLGEGTVSTVRIEDLETHAQHDLPTEGVFIFVGMVPQTAAFKDQVPVDRWGYVPTDDEMATAVPGVYAAGDLRVKSYRQITTAVADGTIAALAAQKYLKQLRG